MDVIHLRTLVVVTDADAALRGQAVRPEATKVGVSLWHVHVGHEEPQTKDGLSQHVQDCVSQNLLANADVTGAIGDTPNTVHISFGN